jgi:hypothetical protein
MSSREEKIVDALSNFDLDEPWRDLIYTDANDLLEMGFPADFIHDLIAVHETSPSYIYQHKGKPVLNLIGIAHTSLIWAIAEEIGADTSVAMEFTGEGFRNEAIVREIRKEMHRHETIDPNVA